jgi:hypothetical protein
MKEQQTKETTSGQSLVEMSLILPLLFLMFFGILDIGWYVYNYGTVYQAARNGSDNASNAPPWPSMLGYEEDGSPKNPQVYEESDPCVDYILTNVRKGAVMMDMSDLATNRDKFTITYHSGELAQDGSRDNLVMANAENPRRVGNAVQVAITYTIEPLTPLVQMIPVFGSDGRMTVQATSFRTIYGRGIIPGTTGCTKVLSDTN